MTTSPPGNARERLIEAAVRHLAEHGFKGASQRAIQRDAGVNPASANYYFGSKEALFQAVIEHFIHDIQAERVRRHGNYSGNEHGAAFLVLLLSDYFEPGIAVAATEAGFAYARILARVQAEVPGSAISIFYDAVRPVRQLYLQSLRQLFPHVTANELNRGLAMGVALMANEAVRIGAAGVDVRSAAPTAASEIARFVAAGLEALHGPAQ